VEQQKEEVERFCFDCNYFFPASEEEPTEFGICLNDEEFEPFAEKLLSNSNYACCKDLIERKKFSGNQEACPGFSEVHATNMLEIDDDSELGRALSSAAKSGQLDRDKLLELLLEEQIRNIDFKNLPTDKYSEQLKSGDPKERDAGIESLSGLIGWGNKAAARELREFLKQLPVPSTIEEVHFKIDVLRHLDRREYRQSLIKFLIKELYNTPSSNTTRQWISAILECLGRCPAQKVEGPLRKMLEDKRFSFKIKRKIREALYDLSYEEGLY